MRILLISFFDESCPGLRSVGAALDGDGHEVHFLHVRPFLYEAIAHDDDERIAAFGRDFPFAGRDVEPLGDIYIWAHPLPDDELEVVASHVCGLAPDAIGMSVAFGREQVAAQVGEALRSAYRRVPIIWGGVQPTVMAEEALEHADIVCVGDGEAAMTEWARNPTRLDVPGLCFQTSNGPIRNEPEPPPLLDTLPLALYGHNEHTLLDGELSTRTRDDPDLIGRIYIFSASRGCRFDCSYCLSGRVRRISKRRSGHRKSVRRFVDEIVAAKNRFNVPSTLPFWDDIFTEDIEWLREFALLYPREVGLPFACQTHPNSCSDEALELLIQAGVAEVAIGLESGSRRILKVVYGRSPDIDRVVDVCHHIVAAGVPSLQVDLITNNPYDTEDDCRETLKTLLRLPRPYKLEAAKLVIFPGSRMASYSGPLGGLSVADHDFFNMLYLLTQSDQVDPDEIRAWSGDEELRQHPEKLRLIADKRLNPGRADNAELGGEHDARSTAEPAAFVDSGGSEMTIDVLIVGAGPLPAPHVNLTTSYQLRTAKLTKHLQESGFTVDLCAVDLLRSPPECFATAQDGMVRHYNLIPQNAAGASALGQHINKFRPSAILAISAPAAAMVCRLGPHVPIWADMPGWLMPEAQLKAAVSGNDGDVQIYAELESVVLGRADKISVVCENQLRATFGEIALLGRLSRRCIGYEFLHVIPSLAIDWSALCKPAGGDAKQALGIDLADDALIMLWSGSFNVWTDVEWVYQLLENLMTRLPQLHFVATGRRVPTYNDPICDRIENMIESSAFSDRCHLLPWLEFRDALAWFQRADIGLCIDGDNAEVANGSRTRIVDMLAHGLPVAATVGTELTLDMQKAGVMVALDPHKRDAWTDNICDVLESPERLQQLRDSGRQFIFEKYGLDATCGELVEWLRNPGFAPDNEFKIRSCPPVTRSQPDGPDGALLQARPMATWRPQQEIEEVATAAMSPDFGQQTTRLARWGLQNLLKRPLTRVPTVAAWNVFTRVSKSDRLAHWQSWIEGQQPRQLKAGLSERISADAARRVYPRALQNGEAPRFRKSLNVLMARHDRNRSKALMSYPQRIEVEPSSVCNIQCRMCPLTHVESHGTLMSDEVFDRLQPCFQYAPLVEFIGRGEPTLHPRLPEFLGAATTAGSFVRMFTNGTRLNSDLATEIVRLGVDEIVLSMVGGNRKTYQFMTGRDRFDDIVENFKVLQDIKRVTGSPRPAVSICSTLLAGSLHSAPGLVLMAAQSGIQSVFFGAAYVVLPEMEQESLLFSDPQEVEKVFSQCREVAAPYGVTVAFPPIGEQVESVPPISDNQFGCLHPWLSVLARADGNVELCSYNRKIVGDLQHNTLEQIWNGPEFERFRLGLVRHNGVDYCDMCYHRAFRSDSTNKATHFPYGITFDGYQ